MSLSTHVLDTAAGAPAAGVPVRLEGPDGLIAEAVTDGDGRVRDLPLAAGTSRLVFDTSGLSTFFPVVTITFAVVDPDVHLHVPLLLSPHGYTTYRGS